MHPPLVSTVGPAGKARRAVLAVGAGLALMAVRGAARAQSAPAATPPAVSLPPAEARLVLGPAVRLRGSARLRMLGLSIYEARLWVGDGFEAMRFDRQPLALELQYARSLKGSSIAERSIEEMRRGGAIDEADERRWLAFMKQAFPDVGAGDRITGTWQPEGSRAAFHVNSGAPQVLTDPAFGPRFFGIWLAPHTSQPSLRQQLLGLA